MREIQTFSDSLQPQNQTISDFFRRTDTIADRLGLNLSEIPELLGISKAMLFAYRKGKNRITPKVWLKLERAERDAGISVEKSGEKPENAESTGNPKYPDIGNPAYAESEESGTTLRDEPMFYPPKKPPDDLLSVLLRIANAQESIAASEIANVESQRRMASALEKLVEIGKNKTP